jgi:signal transduction histidine kinase/CheY-like chemotaxis protein/streptogramin lyase
LYTLLRHIFISFIFWTGSFALVYSQNFAYDAQKINIEDGLPHRGVHDITQSPDGYIWASFPGIISRYDGRSFKTYHSSFLKTGDNLSCLIASDKNNNLWYCEGNDVGRPIFSGVFDTKEDSIYLFEDFSKGLFNSRDVLYLSQSKKQPFTIFIATRNGIIYKYTDHFEEIYRFPQNLITHPICEEIYGESSFLILHKNLMLKVKDGQLISTYTIPDTKVKANRIITQGPKLIVEAKNYRTGKKSYWELYNDNFIPYDLTGISEDTDRLLHKTTDYTCYAGKDSFHVINNANDSLFQFSITNIYGQNFKYRTVFVDRQNILWIASNNGLCKIIPKKNPFKILQEGQSIRGIFKDNGHLYVGSYTENVRIDLKTNEKNRFINNPNVTATSFIKDKNSNLWVGSTSRLLYQFLSKSSSWKITELIKNIPLFIPLINSKTGKLWIGTGSGLAFLDAKRNQIEFVKLPIPDKNNEIRQLYQNDKGIWVISSKGIFLLDAETEKLLKHYTMKNGLPHDNLNHLYEDKDGTFWLASKGGGLIHWDPETNVYKQYTIQSGLSNNTIYAVYPDDYNNLWLSSNYGLMRFDKETKDVNVYLSKNGIANEEFNTFAHFKDKDGTLYFGGLNGVTIFHPKDLIGATNTNVPIRLTQIQVLNEFDSDFIDVTKSFIATNSLTLKPTDRVLVLDVSLLDYEDPDEIQYMYQIKGYQDQWLYTKNDEITFNNLPYGNYSINVKGKGLAGNYSSNTIQIPITVERPFYLTWQFIFLMFLFLTFLIYGGVKWRISNLQKIRRRLEKEVQIRTKKIEKDKKIIEANAKSLKELDKAKTRFFSNITHEFRTPLTLIIGPLEQLTVEYSLPVVYKRRVQGTIKHARHILMLINQLLDLSKIEAGQMKLELVYGDIISHTRDIVKQFQAMANQKDQHLVLISKEDSWNVPFDQSKWDKILFNLLSNAIKFTSVGGIIQISLVPKFINKKPYIRLDVADSGIGIEESYLDQIFNRFYQIDPKFRQKQEGTGIGLSLVKELVGIQNGDIKVISAKDKGTTFEILLPVSDTHPDIDLLENRPKEELKMPNIGTEILTEITQNVANGECLDILIVEDNVEMREYIRQCLKNPNYNITEAANGNDGFQKALSIVPDLIISDVIMPKMDGYELTREIRENIGTSHIPIVLLTAKSSMESKLKGLRRGADAYLTKPFSPLELQLNVQNLIQIRAVYQKRYLNEEEFVSDGTYEQENEFITKLKDYILENITEPNLNGDHIGKIFGLSRVHLYRKLKALTNQSITDFVKRVRLERAMELLKEGDLNVSEISDATGFATISHFSSSFKKFFGKTPSQV